MERGSYAASSRSAVFSILAISALGAAVGFLTPLYIESCSHGGRRGE
jgi:hypothetical protein